MTGRAPAASLAHYREAIAALPRRDLRHDDVLEGASPLADGDGFAVHYAPFDHVNRDARIVLVGLTPGWQQTELAFETARDRLLVADADDTVL